MTAERGPQPINPPCVSAFCAARRWALHDVISARQIEQQALALHPPHELMARAGLAVARWALAMAPHARHIDVWVGPGNNGGDGLVAARHLHQAGKRVRVSMPSHDEASGGHSPRPKPSDASWALDMAQQAGVPIVQGHYAATDADLVIDALLGLGASRAPRGAVAQAIAALAGAAAPVLSIDLPSGLNPNTGSLLGEQAIRAKATLSLLTLKPGCFTAQGRDHAGTVWLDRLGLAGLDTALAESSQFPAPTAWLGAAATPPQRRHASHKGLHGDVAVIGGANGMQGAALLAARAALAAGAGRVFVSLLTPHFAAATASELACAAALPWDPWRPELMLRQDWWHSAVAVMQATTVVCGCGGGQDVAAAMPALLAHAKHLVLDADALNAVAADSPLARGLRARSQRGLSSVITPHPREAARLLLCSTAQVQNDRFAAAAELVARYGAVVVLKGSGTVIASTGAAPTVNTSGNGALAGPGTGDVLAGWLGGRWAQSGTLAAQSVHAMAAQAVWEHGRAADWHAARYPGTPLRASELVEALLNDSCQT